MQFGRIDGNAYILDFQYPFSAVQAFAVALANVTQRLKWTDPHLPSYGFKCNLLKRQSFNLILADADFDERTKFVSTGDVDGIMLHCKNAATFGWCNKRWLDFTQDTFWSASLQCT